MAVLQLTSDNFSAIVTPESGKILIDFYATWCGPCQRMAPLIESIAEDTPEVTVCKVDVDQEPALAERYGVSSIPTFVVLEHGALKTQAVGARPREEVLKLLS